MWRFLRNNEPSKKEIGVRYELRDGKGMMKRLSRPGIEDSAHYIIVKNVWAIADQFLDNK